MHTQKDGLHPGAARKEAITRSRTTLTLSDPTKTLLQKIVNVRVREAKKSIDRLASDKTDSRGWTLQGLYFALPSALNCFVAGILIRIPNSPRVLLSLF
ncbi:hypothetical protein BI308_24435 [Roseofilum reptotaenium AO1-A]|uniref:Uncharacterized protein n=1 Tax=Roseofilum reptotaenium AO1-A TaxID=1925591 RepID=A0A1L9QJV6_9CYAN|nr:hypothetical protein BI308_24435 [Roseofilum reptotaenium AO1-A]